MNTNQVSVGTPATLIVAANPARSVCWITGSAAFYVGPAGVTTGTGFLVPAGTPFPVDSESAIYGVVGSSTSTVCYLDENFGAAPFLTK